MIKMIKDGKKYDIEDSRVEKLLKRGFELVIDTPEIESVDHEETNSQGD